MPKTRSTYTDSINFFAGHAPHDLLREFGSPLYVYNENILRKSCKAMQKLVKLPSFRACYSAKANANPHLLRIVRSEGLLVDSMSPGELAITQMAGFTKDEIIYVCNNVAAEELADAAAQARIVSVDSLSQLELFGQAAPGAEVMIRLNPGIGAGHHQKVITAGKDTKFGVNFPDMEEAGEICAKYDLKLVGLNQHVGSLFMEPEAFLKAASWLLQAAEHFKALKYIDFGGGFGIPYHKYEQEKRLDLTALGKEFTQLLGSWSAKHSYKGLFIIEPGRYIPAESGLVLGSVTATKNNGATRYACTDVGFNILPRPMLYDAFHDVEIYRKCALPHDAPCMPQTIVGNICESGDILAKHRDLPEIFTGDVLGFLDAGAYCYAMASSYNQRVRPAEVLIQSDGSLKLIRRRETTADLTSLVPPLG